MGTLYISDLDGTLLTPEGVLSEDTIETLNAQLKQGVQFTFATARTAYTALPITAGLNLSLPVILMNGVMIYDPAQQLYTRQWTMDSAILDSFLQLCDELRAPAFVYTKQGETGLKVFYSHESLAMETFRTKRERIYQKPFERTERLQALTDQDIVYVNLMASQEMLQPLLQVARALPLNVSFYPDVYWPDTWLLEIHHVEASKGTALAHLKQSYRFEQVYAFGDNLNDLSLFAEAETKIAVANAAAELKIQADTIIGSNAEDSVAAYMEQQRRTRRAGQ